MCATRANLQEVPVDHPGLSRELDRGGKERHSDAPRWTKGDAVLPATALTWPAMLEVRLGGEMTYAITTKPEVRAERTAA